MARIVSDPKSIEPSWVACIEMLKRLEEQPYHWPIGRAKFQKLAYFSQHQGLPLGFSLSGMICRSITTELKNLMRRFIDIGLIREERLGRMCLVKVGQTYEDAYKAYATDLKE